MISTLSVIWRGYAEFDDVFHNTLGCLIGFVLYAVVAWVVRCVSKKERQV